MSVWEIIFHVSFFYAKGFAELLGIILVYHPSTVSRKVFEVAQLAAEFFVTEFLSGCSVHRLKLRHLVEGVSYLDGFPVGETSRSRFLRVGAPS